MDRVEWEQYKVDVPEGQSGDLSVRRITVTDWCGTLAHPTPPGTYTELAPWMSDKPAEIYDLLPLFDQAKGRVLLTGLGLGVALGGVLLNPDVSSVDVVESNPDVIALVWAHYAVDSRAHLHHQDAFDGLDGHWDVAWHDIWAGRPPATEIAKLSALYSADWTGYWSGGRSASISSAIR